MKIKICNIEDKSISEEKVCAEASIKFLYDTAVGRFCSFLFFARALLSKICGLWADSKVSGKAVAKFIKNNNINTNEMLEPQESFKCFNDFFTRALKADARPLAKADSQSVVSFPADGRHILLKNASAGGIFYAKGKEFNLKSFLGDDALAARYEGGDMLISRLSPLDYHRFHYPISGEICARKLINGALYSVSPIALAKSPSILWENKRMLNFLESPNFGLCAFVEIGATNVGSIINFGKVGDFAQRGNEAGMFKFGASCLITIFPRDAKIKWNKTLEEMSSQGIECYARVNTLAGELE